MKRNSVGSVLAACAALVALGTTGHAWAQDDVDVTIDTASLEGEAGSELFIELTGGGSDSGVGYNTVTTSPFVLGGGTAGAVDTVYSTGNVSGDMTSGVSLNDDGSSFNLFGQYLTPGTDLSFELDLTTNANTGAVPDGLTLYLYDPSGNSIATTSDPSGFDSLLEVDFNTAGAPAISNYDTALVSATPVAAAPEIDPGSATGAATLLAGLLAMLCARRTRRS